VLCNGAENCKFDKCHDEPRTCPDGTIVCGRDCA
jgi:hypothetical protein